MQHELATIRSLPLRIAAQSPEQAGTKATKPYRFSSILLGFYVFTVPAMANDRELVKYSTAAGLLLVAIFGVEFILTRQRKLLFPPEFTGLWFFITLVVASCLWATSRDTAIGTATTCAQLLALALITFNILVSRRTLLPLTIGFVTSMVWVVLGVLLDHGGILTLSVEERVGGALKNANAYAVALVTASVYCWYIFQRTRSNLIKCLLVCCIIIFSQHVIFFSGSRKGMIALVIAVSLYILLRGVLARRASIAQRMGWVLLAVAMGTGFWMVIQLSSFASRFQEFDEDLDTSGGKRGAMVVTALELWESAPILGKGVNQFREYFHARRTYSHNNYVELLANNGLLGFTTYYSFFVLLVNNMFALMHKNLISRSAVAWMLVIIVLLLFWDVGVVSYYAKNNWLLLSVLAAMVHIAPFELRDNAPDAKV